MPTDPMYSPYLEFNPSFKWGGRSWSAADRADFMRYLKKRGRSYDQWARRHPNAAKVFDPVENQLYSYFQPQLTGIEAERKRTADAFARRMQNLGGFWASIAPLLGGIAPAIGGAYGEGAETMQAGGTGYGNVLNQMLATDAAGANQILTAIGAPEGQNISGGDAGSVLAGVAGWVPAQMMGAQGKAYAEAASQLPKTASLEAQIMAKNLMGEAAEADKGFSDAVLGLLQELPGYRQKLGQQATADRLDQQKFRLAQLKEEHDWYKDQAALALAAGDNALARKYFRLAQEREKRYRMQAKGLAPDGSVLAGYYEDAQGNIVPKGYRYNAKGELVSIKSGKAAGTNWYAEARKDIGAAQDDMDKFVKGTLATTLPITDPVNPGGKAYPPYAEAFRTMFDRFKHLIPVQAKPALRKKIEKELRDAIRAALIRNGIKPGGAGEVGGRH